MVVKQDTGFTELINKSVIVNENKVIEEKYILLLQFGFSRITCGKYFVCLILVGVVMPFM